jgi:hypothetical protein
MLAFLAGPLYFPPMRRLFRQLLVLVTSLAFVAGMVQQSVAAANGSCPLSSPQSHLAPTAHSAPAAHAGHDHHHGTPEQKKDAACAKCCGVCVSTAGVSPPAMTGTSAFAPSLIRYALESQRLAGRPVAIDPGIPKRTA